MTTTERKVHLLRVGVTITKLARDLGMPRSRGNVSEVIHGRLRSERIETAICEYLGVDRAEWFSPAPEKTAKAA